MRFSMAPRARRLALALSVQSLTLVLVATITSVAHSKPQSAAESKLTPRDGQIAFVTARALESYQLSRRQFDDNLSKEFFEGYLDYWDPENEIFFASDIDDFAPYKEQLDDKTLAVKDPDLEPAKIIFERFLLRFAQKEAYIQELLKTEKFTFDSDEEILLDREDAARPKDLAEAKELWRQLLRADYLREKEVRNERAKDHKKVLRKETIEQTLSRRFSRNLEYFKELEKEDILGAYLTSLAKVYDPHSDYLTQGEMDDFRVRMNLKLTGIGVQLSFEDGLSTISKILPGGPASKSTLRPGDRIVAVVDSEGESIDIVDMRPNKIIDLIRGKKGTEVKLAVVHEDGGEPERIVALIRDEVDLEDNAVKGHVFELKDQNAAVKRIGVVEVPSFYAGSTTDKAGNEINQSSSGDVAKIVKKMVKEGVDGIILDVRGNSGGLLREAIRMTGLFIERGPVVQLKDSRGSISTGDDKDPTRIYDGPLMVLTDKLSASASEILAGALQDYDRAVVVGATSTWGKGTVQQIQEVDRIGLAARFGLLNAGALRVTNAKFYLPSGESTQKRGVLPNITLPSVLDVNERIGEAKLDNAIPWDEIPSANYKPLDLVTPYETDLRLLSAKRIAEDPEFEYIREDMLRSEKRLAKNKISLNEKKRLAEAQEARDIKERRKKERIEREKLGNDYVVYELSLKQASKPGLSLLGTSEKEAEKNGWVKAEKESEKEPEVDPMLTEARNIMQDYISLMRGTSIAQRNANKGQ